MVQAYDHLRELKSELGSKQLLVTLGNHDVDFKKSHNQNPFEVPRTLHPDFPHVEEENQRSFWADGFYIATLESGAEAIVLNTVVDHHDETTAKRGTFDEHRLSTLQRALESRYGSSGDPEPQTIRIALLHHHPILHSSVTFGSGDVLQFGDQLLELLRRFGFRVIVHGHRHDPRITRQTTPAGEVLIFASGSFSALLQELSSTTRNLFHLIRVELGATGQLRGTVRTWEYGYGLGWRPSTPRSAKMPFTAGFASPRASIDLSQLKDACTRVTGMVLRGSSLNQYIPELSYLLPDEISQLQIHLKKAEMKLTVTEEGEIDSLGVVREL